MIKLKSYASIWDAIADTPADAARRCSVSQPRINDLLRGRISRFSLDALVNMASILGWKVTLQMKAA